MHFKAFKEILHQECANCSKSFRDEIGNIHQKTNLSAGRTTLMFTDFGFASSLVEDITHFQAISYIYGIPASLLEKSIKKHLTAFTKEEDNTNAVEGDQDFEDDDPLSSLNLTLCQNCSRILAELYTVFYKFEKLSNKRSIIVKGVQYSKESLKFQDIKLEKIEVELETTNEYDSFEEINNDTSQNSETVQFESVKEEDCDSHSSAEEEANYPNSGADDNNYDSEEAEPFQGFEVEAKIDQPPTLYEPRLRRSQRITRRSVQAVEPGSDGEENIIGKTETFVGSSGDHSSERSAEESEHESEEADDTRNRKLAKRKSRIPKTTRRKNPKKSPESSKPKSKKQSNLRYDRRASGCHSLRCLMCQSYLRNVAVFKRHNRRRHKVWWRDNTSFSKWMDVCAEKSYNCDICDEFHISKEQLDSHWITHVLEQNPSLEYKYCFSGPPFSCPKCEQSEIYQNWAQLQLHGHNVHKVIFTNEVLKTIKNFKNSYFCKMCHLPFTYRSPWVAHMNQMHQIIPCSDNKCEEYFPDKKSLQLHVKTDHPFKKLAEFTCEHCERKFPNVPSLWLHIFVHIVEDDESIKAQSYETFAATFLGPSTEEIDGNDFTSVEIEADMKSASETDLDHCVNCGKGFKSFYTMKIHNLANKIANFSKLKKKDVAGRQFICPECGIDCKRSIILREHCLGEHKMIVSTETYPAEEFVKELLKEKEFCETTSENLSSPTANEIFSKTRSHMKCKRCCKVFKSYYNKKMHSFAHKLNIETLDREILQGDKYNCPKCGEQFRMSATGYSQLKIHCLQGHKLMLSANQQDLDTFIQFLQSEKEYCDSHRTEETNSQNQKTTSFKICRICDKVCASFFARRIHELVHTVDLTTVEIENVEGNEDFQFQCPRCPKILDSNVALREHCLSNHNVIASTIRVPGEEFLQFLTEEQELIKAAELKKVQTETMEDDDDCGENSNSESTKEDPTLETQDGQNSDAGNSSNACQICSKTFPKAKVKFYHFLTHFQWKSMKVEPINSRPPHKCFKCDNVYPTFMSFREHCISNHGFNITNIYEGRKQADTGITSGARRNCSKVKATIIAKDGEKFICDVCGKVFDTKHRLDGHSNFVHKLEKKFTCERCGMSFKRMNLLRSHKRVHFEKDNGIRPMCEICGKSYISSKGLRRHKTDYHPKKKLSCPICNKTFASQEYASKHIKKHQQLLNSENKRWRAH